MAIDKLALYNNALLLLGQRKLAAIDEDREPRHLLDDAYDLEATTYCLEIVQPHFASKVSTLSTPAVSSDHDLDSVHTLPADFVKLTALFSDAKLDQPITRYIIVGNTIACEYDIVYMRYTSDALKETWANWTPSFLRVVAAYLAREISIKLAPNQYGTVEQLFLDRVDAAKALEGEDEDERSTGSIITLTDAWRVVYNDALMILGLTEITTNDDDSNRRVKLDQALNSGIVEELLEDTGWQFALESNKITSSPSATPDWGYNYAHEKPATLHRLHGLFTDEHFTSPLKPYVDEKGYWFCDLDTIYAQYVSTDFITNPDNWPAFFRRAIAGRIAKDAAPSLKGEGADIKYAHEEYLTRRDTALSNDAVQSPPRIIHSGSWVNSRYRGSNRNRPGNY